ncbi:MAG: aldehyde dehydrogenase family protein [Planctomycetota bacterium]|nr:aldehyde dehydrogenase family protein [Planctomycetota bacterium]
MSRSLWAQTPLVQRLAFVAEFRRRVIRAEKELCDAVRQDVGKERFECITGDLAPLLASCRWVEHNAKRLLGTRTLSAPPFWMRGTKVREVREPLGRVAIIATWNYPLQLLGIQLMQALAAGNTVAVKPSELSPRSQTMLLEIANACNLPEGTLTWTGPQREEGARLLAGERFDHVVFTGSTPVGKRIASNLANSLSCCTLELSGRDSAIVLHDADPKLAAASIWAAVCMNAGQSCIAPRRALVHAAVYDEFCAHLSLLARKTQPRTLIDHAAAEHCSALVRDAIESGGRDAAGPPAGSPVAAGSFPPPVGAMMRPTAVLDCPRDSALVDGRHFGPAIAVVRVEDVNEAIELHIRCDQHLATSIFTAKPSRAAKLVPQLGVTSVTINDCIIPTAHPEVSIGGRGDSGMGLSRGAQGLLDMTRPVFVSTSKGLARKSLSPPPAFVVGLIARSLRWIYGR